MSRRLMYVLREVVESGMRRAAWLGGGFFSEEEGGNFGMVDANVAGTDVCGEALGSG